MDLFKVSKQILRAIADRVTTEKCSVLQAPPSAPEPWEGASEHRLFWGQKKVIISLEYFVFTYFLLIV